MPDQNLDYTFAEPKAAHPDFDAFVRTIAALRAPQGCSWDQRQTHASISHNMIEEAYEAVDCIERGDVAHLREELGDVLLQVVLQAQMAADLGEFTIDDVCADVNAKMVRRHPHVFGPCGTLPDADAWAAATADLDLSAFEDQPGYVTWEQIKLVEKAAKRAAAEAAAQGDTASVQREGALTDVPVSIPALQQAQKISGKAVACGFEWDSIDGVWEQVYEELEEFRQALAEGTPEEQRLELGDVLFSLVNVGRWYHVDAEDSLRQTCAKFRRRWSFMEGAAWAQGRDLVELSRDELEGLWIQAKAHEREA